MVAKIMLLGSGELGKELVISLQRLGKTVIACDSYDNAPAMQVADTRDIFDMLDPQALAQAIERHKPDYIVPEVEAIATEILIEKEKAGYHIVPSALAVNLTMNRDRIRDFARELGLRTAQYAYAESEEELLAAAQNIPSARYVIKPVMSSSGKGQSVAETDEDLRNAWSFAIANMRGKRARVIIEEFIDFDYEITLLTITQAKGDTLFCAPIGHVQERGDYQFSWQPAACHGSPLQQAEEMAGKITKALGGAGLFGVEFFVTKQGDVIFSELSPRPHDTGMVTLYTQDLTEFDLHARAFLGLPIPTISLQRSGASHVVCADHDGAGPFDIEGVEKALAIENADIRIFGKPNLKPYRRVAVALGPDRETAKTIAQTLRIVPTSAS